MPLAGDDGKDISISVAWDDAVFDLVLDTCAALEEKLATALEIEAGGN